MRALLQSPPCASVQSCGSDCRNCSKAIKVVNGKPVCAKRGTTYACSVQCNTGFKLKTVAGLSCSRPAGLKPPGNFIKSSRNATKRTYRTYKTVGDKLRNMGASSTKQVANVACGQSMDTPECFERLLMGVLPAAYSSNSSRDTGGYNFISPAQDQRGCSACVGFAATAAIEAAINVYKQQSWPKLNLSEADFTFCKVAPPTDCNSGALYQLIVDAVTAGKLTQIASRDCYPYYGTNLDTCGTAAACTSQMPLGGAISMAHNGNAFGSLAMLKQKIILHGGVITAMAKLQAFESYPGTPPKTLYDEEVPDDGDVDLHAAFCYGFADSATIPGAGYWLCKNSWGPSWGLRGTFRIAYGAAYVMPPDYTYALQFGPSGTGKLNDVKKLLQQGSTRPNQPVNTTTDECVWYQAGKAMRLVILHDLLTTIASSQPNFGPTTKAQVLSDLLSSNLGYVADLAAANTTFRVCGTARQLLLAGLQSDRLRPQLEALLSIKASMDKAGVLSTWSEETGENGGYCKWRHIQCNNGNVEAIDFWFTPTFPLKGTLPPAAALQGLSKLRVLALSSVGLVGTLPADWSQLQKVETIQLASNQLTGRIPASWGSLARLNGLGLSRNRLTGPIPESLGALSNLEFLAMDENALTGTIPESLGNLQLLRLLALEKNQLSGSLPESLGRLAQLENLSMTNNGLIGSIPASFGNLHKLSSMYAGFNQLQGSIPASLGLLGALHTLYLWGNRLTGSLPEELGGLVSLSTLRVTSNLLTGALPASLGNLTHLQIFDLHNNRLHGPLPDSYQTMTNLTELALGRNTLTGSVPASWSSLTQLREVYLWNNPGLSGCLPASWQPQLALFDVDVQVRSGTNISGFCVP